MRVAASSITAVIMESNESGGMRMKAIVYHQYGSPDVLESTEAEKPTPSDDEVLLKVHATSVNPADWHLLRGEPYIARLQLGLERFSKRLTFHKPRIAASSA